MRAGRFLWLLFGAASFVAAVVFWLGQANRLDRATFPGGSVFNTSSAGLSSAFEYLASVGQSNRRVRVLDRPLGLEVIAPDAVVFRMRPSSDEARTGEPDEHDESQAQGADKKRRVTRLLTAKEERWIRAGGRLVLGLSQGYGPIMTMSAAEQDGIRKSHPSWADVRRIEDQTRRIIASGMPVGAHSLFIRGSAPIIARWPLDKGEVIVLSVPEVLENGALARVDHLGLLAELAGGTRPRALYFDEYAHTRERAEGVLGLLLEWGFGPALLSLLLTFSLALWRMNVRVGPAEDDTRPVRTEAVDLVDSMAQLYDRALSRRDAAQRYLAAFQRAVAARTGFKGRELDRYVAHLIGGEPPRVPPQGEIRDVEFNRIRRILDKGFGRLWQDGHAHGRR